MVQNLFHGRTCTSWSERTRDTGLKKFNLCARDEAALDDVVQSRKRTLSNILGRTVTELSWPIPWARSNTRLSGLGLTSWKRALRGRPSVVAAVLILREKHYHIVPMLLRAPACPDCSP